MLAADVITATCELAGRRALRTDASIDLARYRRGLAMLEQILPDQQLVCRFRTQLAAMTTLAARAHDARV